MERFKSKSVGVVGLILFIAGAIALCGGTALAKVPDYNEWQGVKKDHDIPNSKFNLGKALKKYDSAKEKMNKEEYRSEKWAAQVKKVAKAAVSLDKVLEKYYKDAKKKHADKDDFIDYLEDMNKTLDNEIIAYSGYAAEYGKGEKNTLAAALKKYIKAYKSKSRSLDKDSTKSELCKVYRGPYRGIGTLLPKFKEKHKKYGNVVDKFMDGANLPTEMCNGRVDFDAEKGIYAMDVTVEYLEKSLKKVLK